jgi:CheY-like chemotaxis protein
LVIESQERRKDMEDGKEVEILLVEDNPIDREITLGVMKKHNFAKTIHVVEDGEEALQYIFNNVNAEAGMNSKPKMILLDLKLPKVDGIEVLRKIKMDDRTKNIPVVVLTSSSEEFDIVSSYDLGVNSYILKPVNFKKMVDAINEMWPSGSPLHEKKHEHR